MPRRSLLMRTVLSAMVFGLGACSSLESPTSPISRPSFEISDDPHGGITHFFFLPPMVPQPTYSGTSDGTLSPTVVVCAWSGTACGAIVAQFSTTSGTYNQFITYDPTAQQYQVNWHTDQCVSGPCTLDPTQTYRLTVSAANAELGHADIQVVQNGSELKDVNTNFYISLVDGRTLPVKFRIELGLVASVAVTPTSASIVVGSTQAFTASLTDLHGAALAGPAATWSSGGAAVATVNTNGLATGVAPGPTTITAVSGGRSGSATLTVTAASVLRWTTISETGTALIGIWGSSATNIYAVGYVFGYIGAILHFDGTNWSSVPLNTNYGVFVNVWGTSPSNVFIVGVGGTLLHFDGTSWSAVSTGTSKQLSGIWGSSASDVFVVGEGGTILHFNGASWSAMSSGTTSELRSVWGSSPSDVFAAGLAATILHFDGTSWSAMPSGTTQDLWCVWGTSASNVLAVGGTGTLLHFDGSSWSSVASGTTASLRSAWGSSSNDIFAVGVGGTILHFDGASWSPMASGTTGEIRGVWGSSSSNVWTADFDENILHGTP